MDNGGITPVLPVGTNYGGYAGGFGGGLDSGIWAFAILALLLGGRGGFLGGGGYQPQYATQDFVQNGFNFNDLQDQNRDILGAVTSGTAQAVAATNQTFHDTISVLSDKYTELQRDIAGLAVGQANMLARENECCCSLQRSLDNLSYQGAMNTASINANTTAQTQKIIDTLTENKIEALQGRINALELEKNLANVIRYPNNFVYSTANPFFNCGSGCGCNGNNIL